MEKEDTDITQLLIEWSGGSREAFDKLMTLVYQQLHQIAQKVLSQRNYLSPNKTLQPTSLINEVYLRLVVGIKVDWKSRAQFFAITSQLMRWILVDHYRNKSSIKNNIELLNVPLESLNISIKAQNIDLLALNEAIEELEKFDSQQAKVLTLRLFGELTINETAETLSISHSTVEREWSHAIRWLRQKLNR